jgi:hypothetical protein
MVPILKHDNAIRCIFNLLCIPFISRMYDHRSYQAIRPLGSHMSMIEIRARLTGDGEVVDELAAGHYGTHCVTPGAPSWKLLPL